MICADNTVFCKICNKQTKYTLDHFARYHLKKEHNISVKDYYDKCIRKDVEGICPVCGEETTLVNMVKGYSRCCSYECMRNDEDYHNKRNSGISKIDFKEAQEKREVTNIGKYGVTHVSMLDNIKDKVTNTYIERYGKHSLQLDHVKESRNSSLHTSECNTKRATGIKNSAEEASKARKNTILERYGVEYISQVKEVVIKATNTKHLKYGFRTSEEFTEFEKYKSKVKTITKRFKHEIFLNENCYYSGVLLQNLRSGDRSKTIDHKISIIHGFRNNISPEVIGAKDNLCLAARKINLIKNYRTEEEFRNSPDFERIINELKRL